jgi:HEAT repeat protein
MTGPCFVEPREQRQMKTTIAQLAKAVTQSEEWPEVERLDEIYAHGAAAVEPLRAAVRAATTKPGSVPNAFIAVGLLGDLADPAAIPELMGVLNSTDEDLMDWVLEALVAIGPGSVEPLFQLLPDPKANWYGRSIAVYVLERLGHEDPRLMPRLEDTLIDLLEKIVAKGKKASEPDQLVAGCAAGRLSEMKSKKARALIQSAFAANVIHPEMTDPDSIQEAYARTESTPPPPRETFRKYYKDRRTFEQEADAAENMTDEPEILDLNQIVKD